MKRLILLGLLISLFSTSCKKDIKVDEVTYEVTLINSTSWHGQYLDENANVVSVNNGANNWQYSFKNVNNLTMVLFQAYPNSTASNADVLMKIYVNGNKVAELLNSVFPQVQYYFP